MFFKLTCLVLLCFFFCLCNGAPEERTDGKPKTAFRYTAEENKLIVKEALRLIDTYKSVYSKEMWTKIAVKHHEKRQQGATGFSHERTASSLSCHLVNVILKSDSQNEAIKRLAERLIERHQTKLDRGTARVRQLSYTTEEDNLIFDELLKPSCFSILGVTTLNAILARLSKKHKDKAQGFENERTFQGLRSHLKYMKKNGQLPKEIMKKLGNHEKDASSSGPSSQNQQSYLQVDNEGQDQNTGQTEDDWVDNEGQDQNKEQTEDDWVDNEGQDQNKEQTEDDWVDYEGQDQIKEQTEDDWAEEMIAMLRSNTDV